MLNYDQDEIYRLLKKHLADRSDGNNSGDSCGCSRLSKLPGSRRREMLKCLCNLWKAINRRSSGRGESNRCPWKPGLHL